MSNQIPPFEQGYHGQPESNPFFDGSPESQQYVDGARLAKRDLTPSPVAQPAPVVEEVKPATPPPVPPQPQPFKPIDVAAVAARVTSEPATAVNEQK